MKAIKSLFKQNLEKLFLIYLLIFGISYLLILPPVMAPDELLHFYRSYQLSELNFNRNTPIPTSIINFSTQYSRLACDKSARTSIDEIVNSFKQKLNNDDQSTPAKKSNLIIPYLPQSIGLTIGKFFNAPPILLLYLGRIFNLLFSSLLLFFAIKSFPFDKLIVFLLVLFPLSIQQLSSLSSDSLTISLSILLISLLFKHIFKKETNLTSGSILILLGGIVFLSFCKEGYALISFMTLLIPENKFTAKYKKWFIAIICILVSLTPLILPQITNLLLSNNPIEMTHQALANIEQQTLQKHFILSHPIHYAYTYILSAIYYFLFSWKLGWLDALLSPYYLVLYFILFITVLIFSLPDEKVKINLLERVFTGSNLFIINLLQMTGMYIVWSSYIKIGGFLILGWQSRYLIPILLLAVPVFNINKKIFNINFYNYLLFAVQGMILITFIYTIWILTNRYYTI